MDVIRRKASRAILLTSLDEILLLKIANQTGGWSGWITPGGGLENGESEEVGLKRELREELGLVDITIAGKVWTRFHRFEWNNKIIEQAEGYFLVTIEKFAPTTSAQLTEAELQEIKEIRWWTLTEIENSKENFAPIELARYVRELLENGLPETPIVVGV